MRCLTRTEAFHDQWSVAEAFLNTLKAYYEDFYDSNNRKQLVYLSLKCCFLKLTAAVLQKKNLLSINCLMEDLATLKWERCPWAFQLLRQLYENEILHSHASAHAQSVFTRRESMSKRSMFNDTCCSPLKEALRYNNADMLQLVLYHGDVDVRGVFERLSEQMVHQMSMRFIITSCVVENCWQFAFRDGKQSRRAVKITIALLQEGFIPDIIFDNERHLLVLAIDCLMETRRSHEKNVLRVLIGGCWNINSIYTKVTLSHGITFSTLIVTIITYALTYRKEVVPILLEAGATQQYFMPEEDSIALKQYIRTLPIPSLKASCRICIRRTISSSARDCRARSMHLTVDTLPIPHALKKCLLLQD